MPSRTPVRRLPIQFRHRLSGRSSTTYSRPSLIPAGDQGWKRFAIHYLICSVWSPASARKYPSGDSDAVLVDALALLLLRYPLSEAAVIRWGTPHSATTGPQLIVDHYTDGFDGTFLLIELSCHVQNQFHFRHEPLPLRPCRRTVG